jgi:hypothetical protein
MIYTICTCDDCGARYAAHCRAWGTLVSLHRVQELEHAVAELRPDALLICVDCAGSLTVTLPQAVRTQAGDWLKLECNQREWAFAS